MTTTIITIPNGFAVKNCDGTFVGFAASLEIAEGIKAKADEASRISATMETITIKAPGQNKTTELLSTPPIDCDLKIGDTVDFKNEYGLIFRGLKVLGFSNGYMMENYGNFIHISTDAPWFPHRRDELTKSNIVQFATA